MVNDISHEEEERICRLIKHHGGEIVLNPTGDGEQVIIDFDDIVELIRAAKRQERADIIEEGEEMGDFGRNRLDKEQQ
jgi:hypothetical protein